MLLWNAVLALAALGGPAGPAQPPKLVVVITIDQLRPDYLERYRAQLIGGLGLLLRDGAVFTNAFQDHAVTETAPGHATILSGRWPAHTGIIRNSAGVQDSSAPLLGVAGPGASPMRFRGTAFFDWLQAAEPAARALSVSRKDRAAILPLGRARQQVYWYREGVFTTSRYYVDSLPGWVRAFNDLRLPFRAAGTTWPLLLAPTSYAEPDSEPYEHGGSDFMFPHNLPRDSMRAAVALMETPVMDSVTLAFALAGVRALGLGARGHTDLLAVSLSTTDAVGHQYGPDSREMHDQVLRVDRYLSWFFGQLRVRYGSDGVLLVLTADHGVTPFPEWSRSHGHPGVGRVGVDSVVAAVNAALRTTKDSVFIDNGMVLTTSRDRMSEAGVNVDSILADLAARLRRVSGVARVQRAVDVIGHDAAADPVTRRWSHQVAPDGGVELVVTLLPFWLWDTGDVIAEHGQPSDLDTRVPLMFWGRQISRGTYAEQVSAVDIAPTLAHLLNLTPAEPVDGHVLLHMVASAN